MNVKTCKCCSSVLNSGNIIKSELYKLRDFQYTECPNCKSWCISNLNDGDLIEAYNDDYYGEGTKKFKSSLINQLLNYTKKSKSSFLRKLLPINPKILDIGCGDGSFLESFQTQNELTKPDLYGIEVGEKTIKRLKDNPNINIKIGQLHKNDFKGLNFDLITYVHVFEHLENAIEDLKIVNTKLKSGGILFISVPNVDSLQFKWFKRNWFHLDPPRHIFLPTRDGLIKMLNRTGHTYSLIKERHFNHEYNIFGWQQTLLNQISRRINKNSLYDSFKTKSESNLLRIVMNYFFFILTLPFSVLFSIIESLLRRGGTVEYLFKKD